MRSRVTGCRSDDVEEIIMSAIGGEPVTTTIEGRERYSVNVRYATGACAMISQVLRRVLGATLSGGPNTLGRAGEIGIGPRAGHDP